MLATGHPQERAAYSLVCLAVLAITDVLLHPMAYSLAQLSQLKPFHVRSHPAVLAAASVEHG